MKKIALLTIATAILLYAAVPIVADAQSEAMTNAQFADILVRVLGTPLPAGAEDLPADEYFEVLANALSAVGLTVFIGTAPNDPVDCARFAEIVYPIVGGAEDVSTQDKLKFLVATINMPAHDLTRMLTPSEAAAILNNPGVAPLIAEGYRGLVFGSESGLAPGFTLEDTATNT